jgi:hypothetical protein
LERFQTVKNKQGSMMGDELRQSFAFPPRRTEPWIWISKPSESSVNEFICGRSLRPGALPVERPGKYELRRTIVSSTHSSEPMVNERRFSDPGPGNDGNDVDIPVGPCTIQEGDILLSTKKIPS